MRESGAVTMTPLKLDGEVYGWRVKETPTHYIDVLVQIYNYRISRTPKALPLTCDRFWCYAGKDRAARSLSAGPRTDRRANGGDPMTTAQPAHEVVITDDWVIGQHLHELRIDGKSWGSFADLEVVSALLESIGVTAFTLTGRPWCEWAAEVTPCPKIASRTVIWSTAAEYLVWVACAGHVNRLGQYPDMRMPHHVLTDPVDRLRRDPVFRKGDDGDMADLRRVLDGHPVPAHLMPEMSA